MRTRSRESTRAFKSTALLPDSRQEKKAFVITRINSLTKRSWEIQLHFPDSPSSRLQPGPLSENGDGVAVEVRRPDLPLCGLRFQAAAEPPVA